MTDNRDGCLERFGFECALDAAWRTELWIPTDPQYDFVDYFEAAVTRNLALLAGFDELAQQAENRGVLPQSDSPQMTLVTDGGQSVKDTGPEGKPGVCGECGFRTRPNEEAVVSVGGWDFAHQRCLDQDTDRPTDGDPA